jgi:hypothetical protein
MHVSVLKNHYECGHSVVYILSQKFQEQNWYANYYVLQHFYVKYIKDGQIRVWSNNSITTNLHADMFSLRTDIIIGSMLDNGDVVDIEFTKKMWETFWDMFPESVWKMRANLCA